MFTQPRISTLTIALIAVSFLFGLTACSSVPSYKGAPNMVDYTYVPAHKHITVLTAQGIESF